MTQNFRSVLAGASLILAILACSWPLEQVPPPNEVQTAAALTLQSILTPSITASASTPAITTTSSPRATATSSAAGSATLPASQTPTYSVPILTVQESTNCRTGPGEDYQVVFTYLTGKELEIVGRYDPGDFWLASDTPIRIRQPALRGTNQATALQSQGIDPV